MKMLYFSVTLMIALLGATAYLALQARDEAVKANSKMDLIARQQLAVNAQNVEVQLPPPVPETPAAPSPGHAAASPAPAVAGIASSPAGSPAVSAAPVASPPPAYVPPTAPAGSPSVTSAPSTASAAAPLTPMQRLVQNSPSIGKVKEFVADQGFVVLSAGSKQGLAQGRKFDLRRDASIVGRITISSADEQEAVADLDFKSVPAGVTVRAGDEIIGMMQQH